MRIVLLFIAMVMLLVESGSLAKPPLTTVVSSAPAASSVPKTRVDFETQVKPILESKCMPCHFKGGKVYDRLPFDKAATVRTLGVKLFTRIKAENDRRLIEDFLAQSP